MTIKNYKIGLKKNEANYAPLSPVSFLERAALVFPDYISIISENKRLTWRETFNRCQLFASSLKKKKIKLGDTVLLHMNHYERTKNTPQFLTDFPGLTKESAEWLGNKGIVSFGVEAVSPGTPGKNNFDVHLVCKNMKFTHMEGLINLHKLVNKGRFQFIGFPLKIRGGTGSPIRAVAILNE